MDSGSEIKRYIRKKCLCSVGEQLRNVQYSFGLDSRNRRRIIIRINENSNIIEFPAARGTIVS